MNNHPIFLKGGIEVVLPSPETEGFAHTLPADGTTSAVLLAVQ
jgi:hypothetical protein